MIPNALLRPISTTSTQQHPALEERLSFLAKNLPNILQDLPEAARFPFSGVIAFQIGDGPIIEECHCPGQQTEFTSAQTFNTLSTGKLFTAIAVMQLVEIGKLSFNTTLVELLENHEFDLRLYPPYIDEKPDPQSIENLKKNAANIRVFDLLSHTAGFTKNGWSQKQIGQYHYSNYGYQLLARIIGKHTPFCDKEVINHEARFHFHIRDNIFKPANMDLAFCESYRPSSHRLNCFEISKEGVPKRVASPEPYPHGSGGFRMTARDLLAFSRALQQHTLIMEGTFNTMLNYQGKGRLGFWVDRNSCDNAIKGYGHPGNSSGMSSALHVFGTNPPITMVVLSNYSGCHEVKSVLEPLIHLAFSNI